MQKPSIEVNKLQGNTIEPTGTLTRSGRKNYLLLLIIIILLITAIGTAYYFGLQKGKQSITSINQNVITSPSPTISISDFVEPADLASTDIKSLNDKNTATPIKIQNQEKGASLYDIKYELPQNWTAKIVENKLQFSPNTGGGFLSLKVYAYPGNIGRREYYCQLSNACIEGSTTFTEASIGNISGYLANGIDNSGGGKEYFGLKGDKFYIISSYNPPSPNEFEKNYQLLLNSLLF